MKKFISLFTAIILSFCVCSLPTYAIESPSQQNDSLSFSNTVTGRLICDDGSVTPVTGYRRDTPAPASLTSNEHAVTYDYIVPLSNKTHEDNVSGYDSTNYVLATLTIYYTEFDRTPAEYLLTRVTGEWSDPNPSDGTRVSDTADILANCTGIGTQNIWKRQVKEGTISSGSYMDTDFEYSIQPYDGAMGAFMYLDLSQGSTRHWTLELECFPIDPTA